jgi:hypothetical protein
MDAVNETKASEVQHRPCQPKFRGAAGFQQNSQTHAKKGKAIDEEKYVDMLDEDGVDHWLNYTRVTDSAWNIEYLRISL